MIRHLGYPGRTEVGRILTAVLLLVLVTPFVTACTAPAATRQPASRAESSAALSSPTPQAPPATATSPTSAAPAKSPATQARPTTATSRASAGRTRTPAGQAPVGPAAIPDRLVLATRQPGDPMPAIGYEQLPPEGRDTLAVIARGGPFKYRQDGVVFQNREGLLPRKPNGYYHEYTVETPGSADRGARRIIRGSQNETYYTSDHYGSFRRVIP